MQTIKINPNEVSQAQIDLIVDYLRRGLVIVYPTDTIYGLGCDARNAEAIEKIKKIKGQADPPSLKLRRTSDKPMLVLISDYEMLRQYCVVSAAQLEYLKKIWEEPPPAPSFVRGELPTTVILKNRYNLLAELTGGLDSLAVRLPANEFLVKIISKVGFPVVSTSLNKTGEPPLKSVRNLEKYFEYLPDLAVDAGECKKAKPSRLMDLRDMRNIKVLRE